MFNHIQEVLLILLFILDYYSQEIKLWDWIYLLEDI